VTRLRDTRAAFFVPFAVDSVLLTGLLVASLGHAAGAAAPELFANAVSHSSVNDSGVELAVDPPSYWLPAGTNVTFEGLWSTGSPLCHVTPLWFDWAVESGKATGFLNATTGPSTTFDADSFDTGTVAVVSRAGAVLECGTNETVIDRTGESNVTVVAPLLVSGIEVAPNPLLPGQTGTLEGTVEGGEAPYSLEVAWGDGTRSSLDLPDPGPFSVGHPFAAGEFLPVVSTQDAGGELSNTSVNEAVSVGSGLEVGVLPSRTTAEVGVPIEFTGTAEGASAAVNPLFDCSNATVGSATTTPNGTVFPCTFTSPGTAEVLFGEYPSRPGGSSANVILYEPVFDPPVVSVGPAGPVAEADVTEPVRANVSGGILPITLIWNLSGNASGGEETLWSDGDGVIPVTFVTAGDFEVGVRAYDAVGSAAANETTAMRVDPPLESNATGASTLLLYGASVEVNAGVLSGCPPFTWWVVPGLLPSNDSTDSGDLGTVGQFAWDGTYSLEGNLTVMVGVADGCGVTWQTMLGIDLVPPLSANATVTAGPTAPVETLAVTVSIRGGLPPFRLYVNATDGEFWNRTLLSDGTTRWLFPTVGNGSLQVAVSISDFLGATTEVELPVLLVPLSNPTLPPPPVNASPPPTAPNPSTNSTASLPTLSGWILVALAFSLAAAATVLLLGRRRKGRTDPRDAPGPDPVATLKKIIEPADGAERFTVELMAEEAGIPLAEVRSTIDRLIGEKTIHSESGADGEEVLSWSSEVGR
jgi:hypothetical protein